MVVACVLVFFGFMSVLIGIFFPDGTSLTIENDNAGLSAAARRGDVELGIDGDYVDTERLAAGEILEITRRVQRRGASSLTWNDASVGETIARDDAVQTFNRSGAVLEVNNSSQLTMSENSLIVFNQDRPDPFLQKQNSVLLIVDGELSGRIASETDARFSFDMELANSDVSLMPRTPGDEVEFLITVNDDKSATVNIHEGTAQIVTATGVITTIGEQQAVTIDAHGEELQIDELTRAPRTAGPADGTYIRYRNVPKLVTFDWDAVEAADRYRIVVARYL
jgi:hypothetical protein